MKKRRLTIITQKVMAGCLAAAMILTGIVIVPKNAEAANEPKNVHFATVAEYSMVDYWSPSEKKVPVKDGYVFGGWYNADQKTPLIEENLSEADKTAVAKFVPAEVLSIKTQVGTADGKTALRILSTVDSTKYQEVGFAYKLAIQGEGQTQKITKVYSKIKQSKDSDKTYEPGETFVSGVSQYFIAADVTNIQPGSFAKIVYARPFWITLDGTKVMGLARNSRVEDKENNDQYTSVGINLLTDGKAMAKVAAGKIQITYNTANYDVYAVDKTVDNLNGGKYLFPEMECRIDDKAGTITFVGNAVDVTENLTADGLFANVRFKKAEGATGTALDFAINTKVTDFCNWAEDIVPTTDFVVQ